MVERSVARVHRPLMAVLTSLAIVATLIAPESAEARYRHRVRHHRIPARTHVPQYSPAFAAMVVDANSGRTLYARNENELRHPASITKVMTLYLLFEQLEKGRLSLESDIRMSAHAHAQPPTKLGLGVGRTLSVENAIKAVVTRSANDVAVAIAEAIGGSEDRFAELMTQKAHALGMSRTVYVNASGLPDNEQVTTARDLTILGRAIQERFPKYYHYFSTHQFNYAGQTILTHNRLLDRIEGMDGIKTGYTRASGFNLLSSVKRDGHRVVSVVLGGRSGASRDQIMANLIESNIDKSSTHHTASMIAENTAPARIQVAEAAKPVPAPVERIALEEAVVPAPARKPTALGAPLQLAAVNPQLDRLRPAYVTAAPKAVADEPGLTPAVSLAELRKRVALEGTTNMRPVLRRAQPVVVASATTPAALGWIAGAPGRQALATQAIDEAMPTATVLPVARPTASGKINSAKHETTTVVAKASSAHDDEAAGIHIGWMIQIGATDDADKATALLARAKLQGRASLASARPFTEKVQKGETTFYRARFAGLEPASAEAACKALKKSGFACFATRN